MPTSVREAILDQMVESLRAIGSSYEYSSTQKPMVARTRHPTVTLPSLPFIYVGAVSEDYERVGSIGAAGTYDRTLHVEVMYAFTAPNMDEEASRVVHDVEFALRDWTLAGTTSDLEIVSNEVDAQQMSEPVATVTFQVDVRYRTDDNAPATRV